MAMRITNLRDTKNIPLVDEFDLYYSRTTKIQETQNECVAREQAKIREKARAQKLKEKEKARREAAARERASYAKAQELKRSIMLPRAQAKGILEAVNQGHKPMNKNAAFGNSQPLQTWLPGEVCDLRNADFTNRQVIPASHFDNIISDMHLRQSSWPSDHPLVKNDHSNSRADFRGVLVTEEDSPDFSQKIVDQACGDFGRASNIEKLKRLRNR